MFECKKFLCCVASSMFALSPVVLSHAYCGDAPSAAKCAEEMNLEKYFRAKIQDYISSKNLSEK